MHEHFLPASEPERARRSTNAFVPDRAGIVKSVTLHHHVQNNRSVEVARLCLSQAIEFLLSDEVSSRNMPRLAMLLLRFHTLGPPDPSMDLAAYLRAGFADAIASKAARSTQTLAVYLLAPDLEQAVRGAASQDDDELQERLLDAVRAELRGLPPTAAAPAMLTRGDVRRPLRGLLRQEFPQIAVLGFDELPPDFNIQPISRIAAA